MQQQCVVLSPEARDAASEIERKLQLGSKLSDIVNSKDDVLALLSLYKDEGYILTEHKERFCVSTNSTSLFMNLNKLNSLDLCF